MTILNWNCSEEDDKLIDHIATRYLEFKPLAVKGKVIMDLTACHCNGTPLDLESLLDAEDYEFMHDMNGIRNYIDRDTGKLEQCFQPRHAK